MSRPTSSTTLSFLRHFLHTATAMARKKIIADELSTRAKSEWLPEGLHIQNKHVDKVKKDRDAALHRYVL
jgi:hypothetical protein